MPELRWPLALMLLIAGCQANSDSSRLPTGRSIDPKAPLSSQNVGNLPINMLLSPDGKYVITTGQGWNQRLCSIRISDGKLVNSIDFPDDSSRKTNGLYYGIAFAPDGTLYAAQGANGTVGVASLSADGILHPIRQFQTGQNDFPSGLAIDERGHIYVTQNDPHGTGANLGPPGSVSVHDTATGKQLGRYVFQDDLGLSNFPLAVAVNKDGSRLYVGSQRDDAVYVLDATDPAKISPVAKLATGSHPVALVLNHAQSRLYVANAQSDTISIVDTGANSIIDTVLLRPQIAKDLAGATPTGLALSADEKTLYASLGDMNAVAVIDLADAEGPEVEGYIPAGWYPTAVAVAGDQLFVTNGKGDAARVLHGFTADHTIIDPLPLFEGTIWRIAIPNDRQLDDLTKECLTNARLTAHYLDGVNPLQSVSLGAGKIKHVIYIIKENRAYDQVLGDLPQGNGDPNYCLFPRAVTPNQHALAERFVLLDNFYDCGEVSGDGWTWSTEAQANEYTIRNVPYQYSHRGRQSDYEGTNNRYPVAGFPAIGPDGTPLSNDPRFKNGGHPVPDVAASPGGHLWDMVRRNNLSFRNYGCFLTNGVRNGNITVIPDNYPTDAGVQPGGHDLAGITDVDYRRFDLNFPDSDAPSRLAQQTGDAGFLWRERSFGKSKLPSRFAEWKREFDLMLAKDPTGASIPAFMTVRLPTDHTNGARSNSPTPSCMVADNDYAVGELVDAVSHSPIWDSAAIVILEDDAQNGPDHVDDHRSSCLIVSPWIKKGSIDHTFQNTVSAIRTIECLLNLPPMCQYDASSDVIRDWDGAPRNIEAYNAIFPSTAILRQRSPAGSNPGSVSPEDPTASVAPTASPAAQRAGNDHPPLNSWADLVAASDAMDFSRADHAPADLLNRVIWKTVRGPSAEMPQTPHALSTAEPPDKDDDD
jgi:YVTN family beta-propeller protein